MNNEHPIIEEFRVEQRKRMPDFIILMITLGWDEGSYGATLAKFNSDFNEIRRKLYEVKDDPIQVAEIREQLMKYDEIKRLIERYSTIIELQEGKTE